MRYQVAERFKSVQGEGLYAGTPMAFIRFVGCSVGKRICQRCDTDFERMYPWLGGGEYSVDELLSWAHPYEHICLTGGEPLDYDLEPLLQEAGAMLHIETSGTKPLSHIVGRAFICVSPKPGFRQDALEAASEIKVIVPGLGTPESLMNLAGYTGQGVTPVDWALRMHGNDPLHWMTLDEARYWARRKTVFLQPANGKFEVEMNNLRICEELVRMYPELRLSVQLHKLLKVR